LDVVAPLAVLSTMTAWRSRADPLPSATVVVLAGVNVVAVVAWHVPVLFDAAERSLPLHVAEHLSFVLAACALWWAAGLGARPAPPLAVLVVFVASLPGIALGAGMTLSTAPWYTAYPSIVDQQLAGALMWSVGGAVTVLCGALCAARWLSAAEVGA
ncbi:MAG TPA: cytochrome c oxidase assembly protein, partial [Acidimicrobiales bacterium]